jgi:hypothetical protein
MSSVSVIAQDAKELPERKTGVFKNHLVATMNHYAPSGTLAEFIDICDFAEVSLNSSLHNTGCLRD